MISNLTNHELENIAKSEPTEFHMRESIERWVSPEEEYCWEIFILPLLTRINFGRNGPKKSETNPKIPFEGVISEIQVVQN